MRPLSRIARQRARQRVRQQPDEKPLGGKSFRGGRCEPGGFAAGVVPDEHRAIFRFGLRILAFRVQCGGQVHPAPKRIALGSDAYTIMHKQLSERLASLEAQKHIALSTDFATVA